APPRNRSQRKPWDSADAERRRDPPRGGSIEAMQYVNLGRSGLKVSRICLGTMTYGSSRWRPWVLDEEASRPLIKQALEAGINFFDTGDMYSLGASEEVVVGSMQEVWQGVV